ncbi:biotin/lipoate A/B protein ligase [Chloroherpeton thalassium ATCC 35110]|uniref:Biotin/lipoate A/B protein ligase n=1 Tax=Chloroherpeton thalassium (strain ATCC 35110 / GB-78) TaxID=517418 RepID=B3QU29_CHLT3|nr:lipoate--protein ligase family protein [Chloroherpeton thalassium]ACF12827.1 biotin/lipoate A/B protein ligase [Chloroherpeton thalassium ATCC 35110]
MNRTLSNLYVIDSGARSGAYNMQFDSALAQQFFSEKIQRLLQSERAAVVRFYAWSPFAITIGYNQNIDEIDVAACQKRGIDVVRRPTGGRAIFHAGELTYSVVMNLCGASPSALYKEIHLALEAGLQRLGVSGKFQKSSPNFRQRYQSAEAVPCFTASARNEYEVQGKKLIGSAQRRLGEVLLQHGSILLTQEHKALVDFLKEQHPETRAAIRRALEEKTLSISEVLPKTPTYSDLVHAMKRGFEQTWNLPMQPLSVVDFEQAFDFAG